MTDVIVDGVLVLARIALALSVAVVGLCLGVLTRLDNWR